MYDEKENGATVNRSERNPGTGVFGTIIMTFDDVLARLEKTEAIIKNSVDAINRKEISPMKGDDDRIDKRAEPADFDDDIHDRLRKLREITNRLGESSTRLEHIVT